MTYFQEHQAAFLEGLKTFLRIPSISALSEHKPDIRRAAEFARNELLGAGMTSAELIEDANGGNPLVYGEWLGAPGKPTVLFYGCLLYTSESWLGLANAIWRFIVRPIAVGSMMVGTCLLYTSLSLKHPR